jgi:rhodanese-related sulfurtransferase
VVVPIKPDELRSELGTGDAPILVDVRERSELMGELGHLPGIIHIPVDELKRRLGELEPYREKEIITVCRRGGRSHTAAQMFQQAGFRHVHFLEGGMTAWKEKGYPSER